MLSLDLFDSKYERELREGAVDDLGYRRIQDLRDRMDYLMQAYKKASDPKVKAAIKQRYDEYKAERDGYFKVREAEQPQRPPAKGLLKGKDLVTPQQRVSGATPTKPGVAGAVKDVVGGVKRWIKGEPDQGPTYEDKSKKKSSKENDEVQSLAVQRYLTKVRRENPMAYSDIEAIAKHEIEKEKNTQSQISRLQQNLKSTNQELAQATSVDQAQSELIQNLEKQISVAPQVAPTEPISMPAPTPATPTTPAVSAPVAMPKIPAEKPTEKPVEKPVVIAPGEPAVGKPEVTPAELPKKDKKVLRRVRSIQKRLEKRVDQYADKKSAETQKQIASLQDKLDAETAKLSDQGQDVAHQSGNVIDITSRLQSAGFPLPRTGTLGEAESPVIGSMVQQIEKQPNLKTSPTEIYDRNMKAFSDAYQKTRGTKLYYGGSVGVPLPFSDMDALVSVISAFPAEQKLKIWSQLFTDPNYLKGFLDQYIGQRGLIEGDVISMAQQRQAPAQLKAYNLALQILKAARDPKVPTEQIDVMKQSLFKDFGTRIQKHPQGYYYIVSQGKPVRLPDPQTFPVEEHGGGIGPSQRWQDLMKEGQPQEVINRYLAIDAENDVDAVRAAIQAISRDPALNTNSKSRLLGQIGMIIKRHRLPIGRSYYTYMQQYMEEQDLEETVVDVKSGMAQIYRRLAPKIERHRDSFLAGQLYDELENYAELYGAEGEFKRMMSTARNRAHMEYDTNPGGFQNWFWFLPFADEQVNELDVNTLKSYADKRGAQVSAMKADNPNPTAGSKEWIQQAVPAQQVNLAKRKIARKERQQGVAESTDDIKKRMSKLEALALAANRAGDDAKCKMYQQKIQSLKQKLSQAMAEGWSDAIVSRRTGQPRTPYSVYIKGKKWKDFENDNHARAVMDKLKAKFKADGRDPETITIAPTDMTENIVEGIKDTASATAVIACLLTGGSLSGCATAPQQTSAQQVLKTGQDVGRTVQTAKKITRASTEAEVRQELQNLARGMSGRSGEFNNSNILRIWRKINGPSTVPPEPQAPENYPAPPRQRMPQYEGKEIVSKQDFIRERERLLRMIELDTNPVNKQILKSAIRQLENRAEQEGWITLQTRFIREEDHSGAVERAILNRIMVAHTDLLMKFGPEKVMQAAEEVAYNVGDVDEIGTSDVSAYVAQVKQILGADA